MRRAKAVLQNNRDLIFSTEFLTERTAGVFYQFKGRLILKNGDTLNISEVWQERDMLKYGYYWFDKRNTLIVGWDNAPHYPRLANFPHHKHIGAKGTAEPSSEIGLEIVIKLIRQRII